MIRDNPVVVNVQITLRSYQKDVPDLSFGLSFDKQPDVDHIIQAFDAHPSLSKRSDTEYYRNTLVQGLNAYGVPKLDRIKLVDEYFYEAAIPLLRVEWFFNAVHRKSAVSDMHYGTLMISWREIIPVDPISLDEPVIKSPKRKLIPKKPKGH